MLEGIAFGFVVLALMPLVADVVHWFITGKPLL